jgi:hypothetical protein
LELSLQLEGAEGNNEQEKLALINWMRSERIPGVSVSPVVEKPKPGEMGLSITDLVSVITPLGAIGPLIKSLGEFISARSSKATIKLRNGDNEITIDASNIPELQATVDRALQIFAQASG